MRLAAIAIPVSLLYLSPAALAQNAPQTPEVLAQLYKCKTVSDDAARLACFDAGVGRVEQAEVNGELLAIDRQAAQEIKRESFGFNIPSLPRLSLPSFGGDDDEQQDVTVLAIERVKTNRSGEFVFYTKNGQIWEEINRTSMRARPKGDDMMLHIRKAAMGSFLAQVNGKGAGMRVRRTQ